MQVVSSHLENPKTLSHTSVRTIAEKGRPIKRLSIIIPVFNEENTIYEVLERVRNVKLVRHIEKEIIIVDDYSTDRTGQIISEYIAYRPELNIEYHSHSANKGKGVAIHTGISYAKGDCLLIQDADLEYDPEEYNTLLTPIINGFADVVYGSRFIGGNAHRILFFWHSIGNRFLTFMSNIFSNLNLTDMETGYKVFRSDIIKRLPLKERRFGFEPEVTARIARVPGIRIYEVGISYHGRTFQEGKKIGWRDGVRTLFCIVKYKFQKNDLKPVYDARASQPVDLGAPELSRPAERVDV